MATEKDQATPRWVKVSAVVALGAGVLLVLGMVLGGGDHGPGRHSGGDGGSPPPGMSDHERPEGGSHEP